MAKPSKEDWKTFWQILFITVAIVIPLGFCIMGVDNAALKGSLSNKVEGAIAHFDTTISDLAIVLSSEIESLQKEVVKQGKNINFLIHRDRILQEKIAKLEAQVEALECKLEKK